jgi:protein TonB
MNTHIRPRLLMTILLAGLGGCASVSQVASGVTSSVGHIASRIAHPFTPSTPATPAPAGLDDYKAQVARHVAAHNPDHRYDGTLPPLLPAVVVLAITVAPDGQVTDVEVQRSRNAAASQVALASMRRSEPLPAPRGLAKTGKLTFSETFLFADAQRYQLRSLNPVQASE